MGLLSHMLLVDIELMLADLAILMSRNGEGDFAVVIVVMLNLQTLFVEVHLAF